MYLLKDTVPAPPITLPVPWYMPRKPRRSLGEALAQEKASTAAIKEKVRQRRELDHEIERERGRLFSAQDDIAYYRSNSDGPEAA